MDSIWRREAKDILLLSVRILAYTNYFELILKHNLTQNEKDYQEK